MFNGLCKWSKGAVLGIALTATVLTGAFAAAPTTANAQAVYVGGGFSIYNGPVYWWWPIWPSNFYWPPYQPTPRYASIAYSPETGRVGTGYGQWTAEESGRVALAYCAHNDCRSMVWVAEGCAALSTATDGNYGWSYASMGYEARNYSQRMCFNAGGMDCRVKAWVCSGGAGDINR